VKRIIIAGTTSGVGKTTVTTGLIGALCKRGMKVQPFKAGPDYIDPTYHTQVSGEPSRNLDTWLLSGDTIIELFNRASQGKAIAVIEGVMGLYDGHSPIDDDGSTAELAKLLGAPVLLVLDSRKGARSLAAMVTGYQTFDRSLNLAGVILNGIRSEGHLNVCREAIEHFTGIKVLGYLPRRDDLSLPERHLGLIPTIESAVNSEFLEKLTAQCEATFNIEEIMHTAEQTTPLKSGHSVFPAEHVPAQVRIAVAEDKAFSFYYQDSLDILAAWGAEIVPFSPLRDKELPRNTSGLYIGGGFPELYASELAANEPLKHEINKVAGQGIPVYAECGGLMYLGENVRDFDGKNHNMVGAIPVQSGIDSPHLSLGYRTVLSLGNGPLLGRGDIVRGHEFHWSVLENNSGTPNAYRILDNGNRIEGFHLHNIVASYIHLHMGSLPSMAKRFIDNCHRYQENKGRKLFH
jgi:cobyrinic acid a,c-diamide synthase